MEKLKQEALLRMLAYGALAINAPVPGKPLPFTVKLELIECVPSVRDSVLAALADVVSQLKVNALAATPGGGRALVPMLANMLKIPCILPVTATADEYAAVMLYGPGNDVMTGLKVAVIQEFVRGSNAMERMANALWSMHCDVKHAVCLLDADRDGQMVRWAAANPTVADYRTLFTMPEIFQALRVDPAFGGLVTPEVLAAAEVQYRTVSQSMRP